MSFAVVNESDPYWKLRPKPATPDDEVCSCGDQPPIVLQDHLSENPLACLKCNGEVSPERIGFTAELADGLAYWRHLHAVLYALWLDSDEYEDGPARLEDPAGQVNVNGLDLVRELNNYRRSYYWWFQDASVDDFVPLSKCPCCAAEFGESFGKSVCEACAIVAACDDRLQACFMRWRKRLAKRQRIGGRARVRRRHPVLAYPRRLGYSQGKNAAR